MKRALALLALLLTFPEIASADSAYDRSFARGSASLLEVRSDGGDVLLVRDADARNVRVHVVATSRSNTVAVKAEAATQGQTLTLTLHGPGHNLLPFSAGASQRYEIHYPSDMRLRVRAYSGNVSADGLSRPLDMYVAHGNVTLTAPRGTVTLQDDEGNVNVTAATSTVDVTVTRGTLAVSLATGWHGENVRMQSDTGNLTLTVPSGLRARVDASTGAGTVDNALGSTSGGPLFFLFARTGNVAVRVANP